MNLATLAGMSQSPVDYDVANKFEPPTNTQFNVFLDNRVGRLLHLLEIFDNQALALAGFSVLEATGHAVVRVLTSRAELARRLLSRFEYPFSEQEVLCVELDAEHHLAHLFEYLMPSELSINYAYPLLVRPRDRAVVALHCEDITMAGQILRRRLFTLLGENDLGENASGSAPEP